MNKKIRSSLILFFCILFVGCKQKNIKSTDLATEAMERARIAQADVYAPVEYGIAANLYQQMNEELNKGNMKVADKKAVEVVDAANKAIQIARQNKATTAIAKLKQLLEQGKSAGLLKSHPDVMNQATQDLINAEAAYAGLDYDKAYEHASKGIAALENILGGQEALALANLNRARELLDRAKKSTDLTQTQKIIDDASAEIEKAASAYQVKNYQESIRYSDSAIKKLEDIIERYPNDAVISVSVNTEDDNIQLQAYDLIRRLGETITYIKDNNYTNDIYFEEPIKKLTPLVPLESQSSSQNMSLSLDHAQQLFRAQDMTEDIYYEDEIEEDIDLPSDNFTEFSPSTNMMDEQVNYEDDYNVISLELIERIHQTAQKEYNAGNYLNAADLAREGLRLSELFLAGQTLKIHTVIKGDTLWDISGATYKSRRYWLWPNIWRANKLKIKDPDLIYPQQEFRIPPAPIK
ncbi:MAG: LysM peptidoglycan-binding domain-containing protein [Brevinema sp.]